MNAPFLKWIDNYEFEARFSNENRIRYDEIRDPKVSFEEIRCFLQKLPAREADLIELYYIHNKNQKDIAKMFNVTQGAISSRLSRARKRLEFIRDMPKITDEDIDRVLSPHFNSMEMEIIQGMVKTTCQSKTARMINEKYGIGDDEKRRMTQVKVRHRFEKCIKRLSQMIKTNPELKEYHKLLIMIKENLYKLHEVKLPHFDRGEAAVFSLKI